MRTTIILILSAILFAGCGHKDSEANANAVEPPLLINYGVGETYPHDVASFTEGLLFHDGRLYESTGSPNDLPQTRSTVGPVNLATGKIEVKVELDRNKYFGEGIVFLNNRLYQLTYVTKVGFIYDAKSFKQLAQFTFPSKEGWGLTTDGTHLIMSDGTNTITYLDSVFLKPVKLIKVVDNNGMVKGINELEYIGNFIYANIYTTNYVVKIDPGTGEVVGKIDLTSLAQDAKSKNRNSSDLNGIAYDASKKKVYVTGKFWPTIYEIKFNLNAN